jgi:hypothetical protein
LSGYPTNQELASRWRISRATAHIISIATEIPTRYTPCKILWLKVGGTCEEAATAISLFPLFDFANAGAN